ncbi:MAG: DUF1097 domain-containing protein, partial [bacterium]|nr:DUF1097 domain-containing protein [bacterium]
CPVGCGQYFILWVAFQTWAMYFMAGCTIQGGVKVLLGYIGGITASIGVFALASLLSFCGDLNFPLAVLILVVPIICFERVPWFDFIPAWFVGSGAFFALSEIRGFGVLPVGTAHFQGMGAELISGFIGICFGIVTVTLRGKYEASLKLEAPAEEA